MLWSTVTMLPSDASMKVAAVLAKQAAVTLESAHMISETLKVEESNEKVMPA